ncbi:MAG: c-type cytochrome [Ottowia sp.]|uniref:c-type cytochrome n=1 Tax=Ottowia sp. TaxID=1898956 RepID=UPI003C72CF5C
MKIAVGRLMLCPAFLACALWSTAPAAQEVQPQALASKYACTACHAADRKLVGPAWSDIAAKYASGGKTDQQLAQSIRKGGAGSWGAVPMPPQPSLPEADALALARWVLAAKR